MHNINPCILSRPCSIPKQNFKQHLADHSDISLGLSLMSKSIIFSLSEYISEWQDMHAVETNKDIF